MYRYICRYVKENTYNHKCIFNSIIDIIQYYEFVFISTILIKIYKITSLLLTYKLFVINNKTIKQYIIHIYIIRCLFRSVDASIN